MSEQNPLDRLNDLMAPQSSTAEATSPTPDSGIKYNHVGKMDDTSIEHFTDQIYKGIEEKGDPLLTPEEVLERAQQMRADALKAKESAFLPKSQETTDDPYARMTPEQVAAAMAANRSESPTPPPPTQESQPRRSLLERLKKSDKGELPSTNF